jgi:hypothetical protein
MGAHYLNLLCDPETPMREILALAILPPKPSIEHQLRLNISRRRYVFPFPRLIREVVVYDLLLLEL